MKNKDQSHRAIFYMVPLLFLVVLTGCGVNRFYLGNLGFDDRSLEDRQRARDFENWRNKGFERPDR